MKQILFVCTGNSCRSVMAEGLFRKLANAKAGEYTAASAGIGATDGFPATQETVRAMKAEGVDMSGHQSRRLTAEMIRSAHKILAMEMMHKQWILDLVPEARDKVQLLAEYSSKEQHRLSDINIPDPIRMSESFYKNVLTVIRDCVANLVKTL